MWHCYKLGEWNISVYKNDAGCFIHSSKSGSSRMYRLHDANILDYLKRKTRELIPKSNVPVPPSPNNGVAHRPASPVRYI